MHVDIHQIRSSAPTWRRIIERRVGYLRIIPSDLLHIVGRQLAPEMYADYSAHIQSTTAWSHPIMGILGPKCVLCRLNGNAIEARQHGNLYKTACIRENNTLFIPTSNGVYYAELEGLRVGRYYCGTTTSLPGGSNVIANANLDYLTSEYTCNNGTLFFGVRRCITWTFPIALLLDDRVLLVHPDSGTTLCTIMLASITHNVYEIDMQGPILYMYSGTKVTAAEFRV